MDSQFFFFHIYDIITLSLQRMIKFQQNAHLHIARPCTFYVSD